MNKNALKWAIYTCLFLVPFIPFLVFSTFFFPFITSKAFAFRIVIEIAFAAWVLLALIDSRYRPKRTLVLYSIFAFLAIIGVADLFGVAPVKSFWSNYERMEGFIALLHFGMFFLVISSVFEEVHWKRWWNTSLVASFLMIIYCVLQLIGLRTIHQGGVRVDGTLGNAIYLAVYMLFHIFIALFLLYRERKNIFLRWLYGLLIISETGILYYTATRGAILGLLGGLVVMTLFNVRNKEDKLFQKSSVTILIGLVILVGGFFGVKDSEFVKNSPVLSRFSSLNMEEIKTQGRYFVWPIALQGVKEHPILGWGQENFNYIFNKHYRPEMYKLEPWFDRAHNIFLDWAVAGGILGLISYLILYIVLMLYIWKHDVGFSHTEKSIFTGLVTAYFFHNFFVFDHLISYILFFSLLSYIHYRKSGEVVFSKQIISETKLKIIAVPIVSILLVLALYFVNVKPIIANITLINALESVQAQDKIDVTSAKFLEKSYNATRLGRPEVVEQIAAYSSAILSSNISMDDKNAYFNFAKTAVLKQVEDSKRDARYELLTGGFFYSLGLFDDALAHFVRAKELMPGKQMIYLEIAKTYYQKGEIQKTIDTLRYVGEISPDHKAEMDGYIGQLQNSPTK